MRKDFLPKASVVMLQAILTVTIYLAGMSAFAEDPQPTARDVIAAVKAHLPVDWDAPTVDTFKAGNPDTPVNGIAVAMMATLQVLQHAAAHGQNLVITHEPTFFDHLDKPALDESDRQWKFKRDFIEQHGLVIWRFHDHWHDRMPDGIQAGMALVLGWTAYQDPRSPYRFKLPRTTLKKLAEAIALKLDRPLLRIVGDPNMPVSGVALEPGAPGFLIQAHAIAEDGVDVLVTGEAREWETVEYAADAISAGRKKALILLGHIPSEQAGMLECARWLKTFIKDTPIEFVTTDQPFWTLPVSGRNR